jgi:Fe-S-cluster containining protein
MKSPEDRAYFFDSGLRFTCTQCGRCCTGEPGTVHATDVEQKQIAKHLGLSRNEFSRRYLRLRSKGLLRERPDGSCIFYKDGCSIYAVRPAQCRTYPFWLRNLRTEQDWKEADGECPGIGQGRLYDREEILQLIQDSPL